MSIYVGLCIVLCGISLSCLVTIINRSGPVAIETTLRILMSSSVKTSQNRNYHTSKGGIYIVKVWSPVRVSWIRKFCRTTFCMAS